MGAAILGADVSSTFLPSSISGLIVWLASNVGTFQNTALTTVAAADADPVGGWRDQSGNGNHVTQSTSTKRPLLKLAIQNGLPVLRFDGVDDFISLVKSTLMPSPSDYSIFVVHSQNNVSAGAKKIGVIQTNGGNPYWEFDNRSDITNGTRWIQRQTSVLGTSTSLFTSPLTDNVFYVVSMLSGTNNVLRRNGVQHSSLLRTGQSQFDDTTGLTIGGLSPVTGTNTLAGDVAEVIIYSSSLATPNAQQVENYLGSKWGIF